MDSQRLVKWLLRMFIVSIVATAAIGIYVIAIPSDNWEYELKVLLTTATIAGASVCGLSCGGCLTRGRRTLPMIGLVLTGLSAALTLVGIWMQPWMRPGNWWFWENYWKLTAVLCFYAVGCAHLSMLFMARLARGYQWAYVVAYYLILGLATVIAAGVVFDFFDAQAYWRLTGTLSILVAAITLLIPVFHWFSREQFVIEAAEADPLFAVEEELGRVKKRLIELENKRRLLLGREPAAETGDGAQAERPTPKTPQSG